MRGARNGHGPLARWGSQLSGVLAALEGLASQYGLLGVFGISTLGSVVPFLPVPYLLVVVLLSGTQDPLLLGVAAGAGGAVGKLTSYFIGRSGYRLSGERTRESLDVLHDVLTRWGAFGVFIFAVTPLPDDVYVIPMGIIRLPFWRFFAANLAGKLVLSIGVAYLGSAYFGAVGSYAGSSVLVTGGAVAFTIVLTVVVIRADWVLAVKLAHEGGLRALLTGLPEVLRLGRKTKGPPE